MQNMILILIESSTIYEFMIICCDYYYSHNHIFGHSIDRFKFMKVKELFERKLFNEKQLGNWL